MSGLQTLATLTGGGAAVARGRFGPSRGGRGIDDMDAGEARGAPGTVAERCRRCEKLLARWAALADRPGADLDPDSPAGREALALMGTLEAELGWLEGRPARTADEAQAKLAFGTALVRAAGSAEFAPRFHAFLLTARAEAAEVPRRRCNAPVRTWLFGLTR